MGLVVSIVIAILVAWLVLRVGKVLLYRKFYDPIGKVEKMINDRPY